MSLAEEGGGQHHLMHAGRTLGNAQPLNTFALKFYTLALENFK